MGRYDKQIEELDRGIDEMMAMEESLDHGHMTIKCGDRNIGKEHVEQYRLKVPSFKRLLEFLRRKNS